MADVNERTELISELTNDIENIVNHHEDKTNITPFEIIAALEGFKLYYSNEIFKNKDKKAKVAEIKRIFRNDKNRKN